MRYSRGTAPASSPAITLAAWFLLSSVSTSEEAVRREGKALWAGEASSSSKQSRGREEGYSNIYMSLYNNLSPLKVVIFSPKSTHFYGAHACLCDLSFQREAFCF